VIQGYGLTETAAASNATLVEDHSAGHVGQPLPCTEVKLVDVPDMDYFTAGEEPKGEVCMRGPNIFSGYYKMADKTKEVLEDDGWFHSGDIGKFNPNGTLSIIDRKKNIFKLSQGEYVAVEKIEGAYIKNPFITQIFVYGDSFQSVLVAIVIPDSDVLFPWAKQHGIEADMEALCENPKVKEFILSEMDKTAKLAKLHGFEWVKNIKLVPKPFSIDDDLITPTYKLKRPQLKKHYSEHLDALYEEVKTMPLKTPEKPITPKSEVKEKKEIKSSDKTETPAKQDTQAKPPTSEKQPELPSQQSSEKKQDTTNA